MYNSEGDIANQLLYGQNHSFESITSKIPIPYHIIPGELRQYLAKILFKPNAKRVRENKIEFPSSYYDNSVDLWLSSHQSNSISWSWPEGKKCALVLSHDTDTIKQEKGILLLKEIAQKKGIKNTFSFVGENLNYYHDLILELISQGVEIALHDYKHDNKIAFLEKEHIKQRLLKVNPEKITKYGISGFRSPSWFVSSNLWDALEELGFKYDMSTLDTWSLFSKIQNYGVCTFYPYLKNNLVIMPTTMPVELPGLLGYKLDETFQFWKNKMDTIANSGGLLLFNAHPDRWYSGNKKAAYQLEKCLDYIIEKYDPALLTGKEVANHTIQMKNIGAMQCIDENKKLYVPFH